MFRLLVMICLLPLSPLWGQKTFDMNYYTSAGVMVTSQVLDIHSSIGKYEANPLARNSDYRFQTGRGIAIKAAFCGVWFGISYLVLRKNPSWKKAFIVGNYTVAAVTTPIVVQNYKRSRAY